MTHMARKIENVRFAANELSNQFEITAITDDDFEVVLNLFNIETISAASRVERIEKSYGRAALDKTMSEIASNEA